MVFKTLQLFILNMEMGMDKLLNILTKCIGLHDVPVNDGVKNTECRHKLEETMVLLDGIPIYVREINGTYFTYNRKDEDYENLRLEEYYSFTISPIHVESGVYFFDKTPHILVKRARKNYKKSFHTPAYSIHTVCGYQESNENNEFDPYSIHNKKRETIYRVGNTIYYLTNPIAAVEYGKLRVVPLFKYEVEEAIESGKIKV